MEPPLSRPENAKCRMQECKMQNAGMQNAKCKMQNAECKMRNAERRSEKAAAFPWNAAAQTVEKAICRARSKDFLACIKSPRQSFAARRRQNQLKSQNSGDRCLGILTAQPASVCALRMRRSGLHPLEKMLAFLRSVSRFLDTLRWPCRYGRATSFVTRRCRRSWTAPGRRDRPRHSPPTPGWASRSHGSSPPDRDNIFQTAPDTAGIPW